MLKKLGFLFVYVALIFSAANAQPRRPLSFTILQINDVYEIAPLAGGKEGGMARVAALRKQLQKKDPNVITVLAGDFLSPSLIGTLSIRDSRSGRDERIAGRQMVALMNATGVDYVTFGNHEFDISRSDLQKRLDESEFTWVN